MRILFNRYSIGIVILMFFILSCNEDDDPASNDGKDKDKEEEVITGAVPRTVDPDIKIALRATKISQLVGETDRHKNIPTLNKTYSRYGLEATDLGVPFQDGETTYILFGDTWGVVPGLPNVMGYTTDNTPEDGLTLDFVKQNGSTFQPLTVPGISQHAFEVPTEGVMVGDQMYIYHTTDHNPPVTMGRSILARSNNDGHKTFEYIYDMSRNYFINVSLVQVEALDWNFLPEEDGDGHVIFGSGKYRESEVYLAYQPAAKIEDPTSIRYFSGVDEAGVPIWNSNERDSRPLFDLEEPCVGEFSVSYNQFIKKWIMMYNCGNPRGINLRTADYPWGPWTKPQVVFEPWADGGYCEFMHTSWDFRNCDDVSDPGREAEWGGEYGPYQFEHFATGTENSTTIYFTLSTWNPYTVILMKATLEK